MSIGFAQLCFKISVLHETCSKLKLQLKFLKQLLLPQIKHNHERLFSKLIQITQFSTFLITYDSKMKIGAVVSTVSHQTILSFIQFDTSCAETGIVEKCLAFISIKIIKILSLLVQIL